MRIGDCCQKPAVTISGSDTARAAAQRMKSEGLGCLVVVTDGRPNGIVTDRDLVLRTMCTRLDPGAVRVDEIASYPLVTIDHESSVEEAVRVIRHHAVRRLPVVDEKGVLVGLIAADDLLSLAGGELSRLTVAVHAQRSRRDSSGRQSRC